MAAFSSSTCFSVLVFLVFPFKMLLADPGSSFFFHSFDKGSNFESSIAFFGDAKAVENGTMLQLTNSVKSSAGRIMFKKPIKLLEGNPGNSASFSTYFSFFMSPDNGDGLAFIMAPSSFNFSVVGKSSFGISLGSGKSNSKFVAVEFDTSSDGKYDDLSDNHVGIDVGGFVSIRKKNFSPLFMKLNDGKRLYAWIDYDAGSKRLEIRLSQFRDAKPIDPLRWQSIDLSKIWNDEEVLIGLSSSNGNSSQTCFIYSWRFELRRYPRWIHSQPLDPQAFTKNAKPAVALRKRTDCISRVLTAMFFGTACGALGAVMMLYLRTIFGDMRPVVPEECSVHPVDFEYKQVEVVVDKAVEDGKQ